MSSTLSARGNGTAVTQLLVAWRAGDHSAFNELVPLVEHELRQLARGYMRKERAGHLLQPTALVNEACIRLVHWRQVDWQNRAHFIAMAARLMRHVLVDFARHRAVSADAEAVAIEDVAEGAMAAPCPSRELTAIDDALRALALRDPRKAEIVELRFFGGLTLPEIAEVIGVAPATVSREWAKARAWLHREVRAGDEGSIGRRRVSA